MGSIWVFGACIKLPSVFIQGMASWPPLQATEIKLRNKIIYCSSSSMGRVFLRMNS